MKAVVKTKPGKNYLEIQDMIKPTISSNEVLISVKAIGVCGTDVHIYTGEFPTDTPIIIGHEFSGEIVEIGDCVKNFSKGDRIIAELSVNSCGTCKFCKKSMFHMCASKKAPGININGCYAEYIVLPESVLHKIPENVSYEEAAIVEPAAIVTYALVERTKIEPEDFVVIMGPGPIGLIGLQLAKCYGASKVMVVGRDEDEHTRLKMAEEFGADYIVNSSKENVKKSIDEITKGYGADLVVECSGAQGAINTGIDILRKQGRMCVIGLPGPESIEVEWKKAGFKALNIMFSYSSSSNSWETVISLLNRKAINLRNLINYRESLLNYQDIFDQTIKGNVVKGVLFP